VILAEARAEGERLNFYAQLREKYPAVPALTIWRYVKEEPGCSLKQYICKHEWAFTGSAYGGDDESYHGEGRSYCSLCGLDGDA
jgi:ribonuclease I